jgi:hypothetical protein
MERLYISWDLLVEIGWEQMRCSLEQGYEPDLITELAGWLDALLYDYDIVLEGCDFRTYRIASYEDILAFIEAYEEELHYDQDLFFKEILNDE